MSVNTIADVEDKDSTQVEIKFMLICKKIALKANNGKYVSADMNQGGALRCDLSKTVPLNGWEEFSIEDVGEGKIALKSCKNGKYVGADTNHGQNNQLKACANKIQEWEKFQVIFRGDEWISLKAHNGFFVGADPRGILTASATQIDATEIFEWSPISLSDKSMITIINNIFKQHEEMCDRQNKLADKLDKKLNEIKRLVESIKTADAIPKGSQKNQDDCANPK